MKINLLTRFERTAVEYALGTALDNEHDKGPEGCGEDIMAEIEAFMNDLPCDLDRPIEITLSALAQLHNYLGCIGAESETFSEEAEPEMVEAARLAIIARIEAFTNRSI